MADLLDIAPATASKVIKLGDDEITVRGLDHNGIATIVSRFPKMVTISRGGGDDLVTRLIVGCVAAIPPIIAAGCGHLGDERYEERAGALSPEQAFHLTNEIFWLSFPNGLKAFLNSVARILGEPETEASFKGRLKKSPSTSQPSSESDSLPIMQ